jgi:uncharacterized protein YciW
MPPRKLDLLHWSETRAVVTEGEAPRPVADAGRQVLGLTSREAVLVFSARRTAAQLLALAPFFRDNRPITPASISLDNREEVALTLADWLHPARRFTRPLL